MKRLFWLGLSAVCLLSLGGLPPASGQAGDAPPLPALEFDGGRFTSYGEIYQFAEAESVFSFVNRGSEPVEILGVDFALLGGQATWEPEVLKPGERGEVRIRQPVGEKLGAFTLRHGLRTTDPVAPRVKLNASGFILSAFEPEVGRIDFGRVDRAAGSRAAFELTSRETASLGPVRVVRAPDWLEVEPRSTGGQRAEIEVAVVPGAPLGFHVEKLELSTGLGQQPVYLLEVRVAIHGAVLPSADPVQLGVMRQLEPYERQVTLRHRDGEPIAVERVEAEAPFAVTHGPCPQAAGQPADPACLVLTLRGTPQERGPIDDTLLVYLAGSEEPVPVRYSGMVAGPDTVIQSLGELELGTVIHSDGRIERLQDGAAAAAEEPSGPASERPPPPPGAPGRPESAASPQAKLSWQVRRHDQVFGFLVYRSEERSGPFVRVNPTIVRADGDPREVGRYDFVDRSVEPGRTYHYYVDTVSRSGLKQRLTGVVSKTVEAAAEAVVAGPALDGAPGGGG